MVDQHALDARRRLGDVEDRVADPIDRSHALVVELDLLPQGAADALHDVALDALGEAVRIDDLAGVVADHEAAGGELAGRAIDLHPGDYGHTGNPSLRINHGAAGGPPPRLAPGPLARLPAQ